MQTVYILNTTILTTPGLTYHSEIIDVERARRLVAPLPGRIVTSAIGHDSTAALASELLGQPVPVNRIPAAMQAGDFAVCIKLRGRAPEGAILTRVEIEAIGYELVLLEAADPAAASRRRQDLQICLDLLASPDDLATGEHTPGTRRRVAVDDYIVRHHRRYGGGYVAVARDPGTEVWSWHDLPAEQASASHAQSAEPLRVAVVDIISASAPETSEAAAAQYERVGTRLFGEPKKPE